ncbi:MAG: lipid A deacylase LpxR family protein [Ectothiorhodospiraceae bacterium]|nr:lipid A deacylase LpxR family protein [Ectothiorhodospiraceae bacterium]
MTRRLASGALLAAFAAGVAPVVAQTSGKHWTFTGFFENDLFADTDRRYTNGIKLAWVSPDLSEYRDSPRLPAWSHALIDRLPFIHQPGLQRNIAVSIGQSMYTPSDITRTDLVRDDRPYAGWLYGSLAFHNRKAEWLDIIEVQAGLVGPLSLAEQAQDLVHSARGIDKARGWDHQLENEPGLNLIWERKWRLAAYGLERGLGADLLAHAGASLGNVSTYANAGGEVRLGWNIPLDFGTALIRQSGITDAPVTGAERRPGVHVFASVDARAVGRDIFLDGNTFADSHHVDREPLVADLALGVSLVYGNFKLSLSNAWRTREFRGQDDTQRFGSIALSFSY